MAMREVEERKKGFSGLFTYFMWFSSDSFEESEHTLKREKNGYYYMLLETSNFFSMLVFLFLLFIYYYLNNCIFLFLNCYYFINIKLKRENNRFMCFGLHRVRGFYRKMLFTPS